MVDICGLVENPAWNVLKTNDFVEMATIVHAVLEELISGCNYVVDKGKGGIMDDFRTDCSSAHQHDGLGIIDLLVEWDHSNCYSWFDCIGSLPDQNQMQTDIWVVKIHQSCCCFSLKVVGVESSR